MIKTKWVACTSVLVVKLLVTHPGLDKFKNGEKIIGKICRVLAWLLRASTLSIGLSQKTLEFYQTYVN